MNKVLNHLKNNIAIYLVLIACIVVVCITLFVKHDKEEVYVDTSLFKVVDLEQALSFFDDNEPRFLLMSVKTCNATINYVPSLQIASAEYGFPVYYLELSEIDTKSEEFKEFREKLDLDYEFQGTVDKFGAFIENTPSSIIIKNKKMVYGYIGSMHSTTIKTITDLYGVTSA